MWRGRHSFFQSDAALCLWLCPWGRLKFLYFLTNSLPFEYLVFPWIKTAKHGCQSYLVKDLFFITFLFLNNDTYCLYIFLCMWSYVSCIWDKKGSYGSCSKAMTWFLQWNSKLCCSCFLERIQNLPLLKGLMIVQWSLWPSTTVNSFVLYYYCLNCSVNK